MIRKEEKKIYRLDFLLACYDILYTTEEPRRSSKQIKKEKKKEKEKRKKEKTQCYNYNGVRDRTMG